MADALTGDRPMIVRKNCYYNGLLTVEAFRSRIFRDVVLHGMARETCEETSMSPKWFEEIRKNTMLIRFFRWIDRGGLAEFVDITRAGNVPFAKEKAIYGDEIIRSEEIPITINRLEDFHKVLDYIHENKIDIVLSSMMALHRMTVIAGYNAEDSTDEQKKIYRTVSDFVAGK